MYGLLMALLRNHEDSADALQECFLRIYRFMPELENIQKFGAWLHRMIINQAHTTLKKRSKIRSISPEDSTVILDSQAASANEQKSGNPRQEYFNQEIKEIVHRGILELPDRQRTAIVLFEMEKFSIKETAEIMDCTEGNVKYHLHEGRKSLKIVLEKMGYAPIAAGGDL